MKKIFLCGLPNVGKTTIGQYLSQYLSLPFIDIDQRITQLCATFSSHKEIFLAYGEQVFRRLETQAVFSLPHQSSVIALGGGSMMVREIETLVLSSGTLIFLSLPVETIIQRLQSSMPESLKQTDNVLATLQHRHRYMQHLAHHTIHMDTVILSDPNSLLAICQQIAALL